MISKRWSDAACGAAVVALCGCDSLLRAGGTAGPAVRPLELACCCCRCTCVNAEPSSMGNTIAALVGVSSGTVHDAAGAAAGAGAGLAATDAEDDPASDAADDAVTAGNGGGDGGGCNVSAPSCLGCVAAACVRCIGVAIIWLLFAAADIPLLVGLCAPEDCSSLYRLMAGRSLCVRSVQTG